MARRKRSYKKYEANVDEGNETTITFDEDGVVKFFKLPLVTGSDAANRHVHVTFEDADGDEYYRVTANTVHAASTTRNYIGRPGDYDAPAADDTVFVLPLPLAGVPVFENGSLVTLTTNFDSNGNDDNWGACVVLVERYE